MITISIFEDDEKKTIIGTLIFVKNSNFFKFFKGYFNYNDLTKTSRKKKRFLIYKE